ncbi:MAG: cytochrome-c peroxidase, partial [bacterium]|nr:cytochrome-c peroxidase [bacterium]
MSRSLVVLTVVAVALAAAPAAPGTAETEETSTLGWTAQAASWRDELPKKVRNGNYYDRGRPDPTKVELGRLLFFDKILSGNRNISCATCHHPLAATGDGLSLSVGEGGRGLGVGRDTGKGKKAIHERVPRNAPPVFNLGAKQFRRMFHDGRVERKKSAPFGMRTPAGADQPAGLENVLAAQAMFPVTSGTEMAGQAGENEVADAAGAGNLPWVWELLAERLRAIPVYVDLFVEVFDDVSTAADISYVHAANAIAAFEAKAWRADNSPFDRYLRGDKGAMSRAARRGMKLFYGRLDCVLCHSGKFQTDHDFHAIGMPQIGPGKGDGFDGREDFGRERVTGRAGQRYMFRTP